MSVAVAAAAGVGAPFETGILPCLPEPPLDNFSSGEAALSHASLNDLAPDGTIGRAARAAALVLVSMGGPGRARNKPWASRRAVGAGGAEAAINCAMVSRAGSQDRSYAVEN